MITNNSNLEAQVLDKTRLDKAELEANSFDISQNQLLDTGILEAMANSYFPEFNLQGEDCIAKKALQTAWQSAEQISLNSSAPGYSPKAYQNAGSLSESDYINAISEVLNFEENERLADISGTDKAAGIAESFANEIKIDNWSNDYRNLSFSPIVLPKGISSSSYFDVNAVRRDFPILSEKVDGKDLIWFDNAATTQKPNSVIDRVSYFYQHENSNVHRGAHTLAARTTDAYEGARCKIKSFLNASSSEEIVFVRGTTEAINLIAQTYGKANIREGDEIVISCLEHHANIVPWQMLCVETGAKLRVIPVDENGQVILSEYEKLLGPKTKIVSFTHVSNALGTITPVPEMVSIAHRYGAKVLVDGAQAVSHLRVDVQAWDCDFYVFSGHKVFGPTGIGVVYGKSEILKNMPPYQGGGNMIADVTFEKTVYQDPPHRFEAGTGNIADAIGLGAAIDYVSNLGLENIYKYEHYLLEYGMEALQRIPGLKLIGTAKDKTSVLSFVIKGFSNDEIGKALSHEGIAVRTGHHCAQPILRRFALESTVRPSLALYNTTSEIDELVAVLNKLRR